MSGVDNNDSSSGGTRSHEAHPSTHDAACDQCRLRKIRCSRHHPKCSNCHQAKLDCAWTNKGKQPNQTKKLANDFEKLGARLGSLETKVEGLSAAVLDLPRQIQERNTRSTTFNVSDSHAPDHSNINLHGNPLHNITDAEDRPHGFVVSGENGQRRHHGASSIFSLLLQSDTAINSNLQPRSSLKDLLSKSSLGTCDADGPVWDSFLSYKSQVYRKLSKELGSQTLAPDISSDVAPLLLPPRALLESLVDGYFRHINPIAPLLRREQVLNAIGPCYEATSAEAELGWVVLFNYIVIRCLAGRHVLEQPLTDVKTLAGNQFDQPFMANIRRAFRHLDTLMQPAFINVQALGALAVISQIWFSANTAQMLLDRACYLAKTIGLHQQQPTDHATEDDEEGRRYLFWQLFILDKDLSLLLGAPPSLHLYDCAVPMPSRISNDQYQRLQACIIEERIYILLYSVSGSMKTLEQREKDVADLDSELDKFEALQSQADPADPMSGWRGKPFLALEMKFIYHQLRVMILHCSNQQDNRHRCLEHARQSIEHLSKIRLGGTTIGGSMVLRRPFQWHSFTPFFEVYSALFRWPLAQHQMRDLELLKSCLSMLHEVAGSDHPSTYCATLLSIATACVGIAETFVRHCRSHSDTRQESLIQLRGEGDRPKRKLSDIEDSEESYYPNPQRSRRNVPAQEQQKRHHFRNSAASTRALHWNSDDRYDPSDVNGSAFDPFFGYSESAADGMLYLTDELMWGGGDILGLIESQTHNDTSTSAE